MSVVQSTTMRRLLPVAAGMVIGAALSSVVFGYQSSMASADTRKAVTAVKQAIVAGHKARDAAALDRLYTDDYTATDSKGSTRTKGDLLAGLKTDAEMLQGQYDLIAVRQWGDLAVATGRGRMVYRNPDGSSRVSEYYSFNVFERQNGQWRYAAAFLP